MVNPKPIFIERYRVKDLIKDDKNTIKKHTTHTRKMSINMKSDAIRLITILKKFPHAWG